MWLTVAPVDKITLTNLYKFYNLFLAPKSNCLVLFASGSPEEHYYGHKIFLNNFMALLKIVGLGETSSVVVGRKEIKTNYVICSYASVIINFKRAHNVQNALLNIHSR